MKKLLSIAIIFLLTESIIAQEFGDAPEGAIAYPTTGIIGMFPTCKTVGPAPWIQHNNFGAYFLPAFDFESDGNGGFCPMFPPYDADECFNDGDAGLVMPQPYTIVPGPGGLRMVTCPNSRGTSLGQVCSIVAWGQGVDIRVNNTMPGGTVGYVNVLFDWDRNGFWAGASPCPSGPAPEHVLINLPVPNGFSGLLSFLGPPPFRAGPFQGFVWARFTITERPVLLPWIGDGFYEDGETEDYLIYVGEYDFGDAPEGALAYPTTGGLGAFPTCMNAGLAGTFVRHVPGNSFFSPSVDGEVEGNNGFCPAFAPNFYDQDECILDGDAGLITPSAYTIVGNVVLPCPGSGGIALDKFCGMAQWGADIDIQVTTGAPAFVNILMDWDMSGNWANNPATQCSGIPVPEHVLVDFPVPAGFAGPLSMLLPPAFQVGPNVGYVWTRFTISDVPLGILNWNGIGDFMDGETEDYLLEVSMTSSVRDERRSAVPFRVIPNPAQDAFRIEFVLDQGEDVRIELRDLDGRLVRVLQDASLPRGSQVLEIKQGLNEVPNGMYLIWLRTTSGGVGVARMGLQR